MGSESEWTVGMEWYQRELWKMYSTSNDGTHLVLAKEGRRVKEAGRVRLRDRCCLFSNVLPLFPGNKISDNYLGHKGTQLKDYFPTPPAAPWGYTWLSCGQWDINIKELLARTFRKSSFCPLPLFSWELEEDPRANAPAAVYFHVQALRRRARSRTIKGPWWYGADVLILNCQPVSFSEKEINFYLI